VLCADSKTLLLCVEFSSVHQTNEGRFFTSANFITLLHQNPEI